MKAILVKSLAVALLATSVSTQSVALNREQKDTAVGAVLGGVAGAMLGNDTATTLAGAALGGVVGNQWNAQKRQRENDERWEASYKRHRDVDRDDYKKWKKWKKQQAKWREREEKRHFKEHKKRDRDFDRRDHRAWFDDDFARR